MRSRSEAVAGNAVCLHHFLNHPATFAAFVCNHVSGFAMKAGQAIAIGLLPLMAPLRMRARTVGPHEDFAKHLDAPKEITPLT